MHRSTVVFSLNPTSTPFRLRPEGSVAGVFRAAGESAYRRVFPVLLHATDLKVPVVYDLVLRTFVSESIQITDDIWQLCGLFGSASYCNQKLWKLVETFQEAPKIVDLQLGAPTGANFTSKGVASIKQIRVFVGFILQPDLKLPKIVPDPEKNKEGKEMNLLILTIQSSLRYDHSGIKLT